MRNTRIGMGDDLKDLIQDALKETRGRTLAGMKSAIDKTAQEVLEKTRTAAPVRTGAYKKSWTTGVTKNSSSGYEKTVYARKPHYRLTHLLQNGHEVRPLPVHPGRKNKVQGRSHIVTGEEADRILSEHLSEELEK